MRKKWGVLVTAGLLTLSSTGVGVAQNEADREADRAAVRKSSEEFAKAFAEGNAKAAAALWTEDGEYEDDTGSRVKGRAALEKTYAEFFEKQPKRKLTFDIHSIRFPSRDTAIEEGVLLIETGEGGLPRSSQYSAIRARENGVWRIAMVREWGGHEESLNDLNWLIGEWSAKTGDREIQIKFAWNARKTAIRNDFTVKEKGQVTSSGIQIITHDPRTGLLHSWMFPDEGGLAEADWFSDGNLWLVETIGVTPSGVETKDTNVIARLNANSFTWRSVHRTVDGEPADDTPPVTVNRVTAGG